MAVQAPIEPLISVVPAPGEGPDVFTNENLPWTPGQGVRGIFGGFLLGHAVRAAQLSAADESWAVHSLQSVFVRPGKAASRFLYRVERVNDGRTFATRIVRAEQEGKCVFVATVSLHKAETPSGGGGGGGDDAAAAATDPSNSSSSNKNNTRESVPTPKSIADLDDRVPVPDMDGLAPSDIPESSNQALLAMMGLFNPGMNLTFDDPFEWRHVLPPPSRTGPGAAATSRPSEFRLRSYVRSRPLSPAASPAHHLAALAFLTDEWLIATVNLAHPSPPTAAAERRSRFSIQTSLSHSVLFHDPAARADEWIVSERSSSWAAGGRVLVEQRFWSRDTGRLVLSCWQEGLVRMNRPSL